MRQGYVVVEHPPGREHRERNRYETQGRRLPEEALGKQNGTN